MAIDIDKAIQAINDVDDAGLLLGKLKGKRQKTGIH